MKVVLVDVNENESGLGLYEIIRFVNRPYRLEMLMLENYCWRPVFSLGFFKTVGHPGPSFLEVWPTTLN